MVEYCDAIQQAFDLFSNDEGDYISNRTYQMVVSFMDKAVEAWYT